MLPPASGTRLDSRQRAPFRPASFQRGGLSFLELGVWSETRAYATRAALLARSPKLSTLYINFWHFRHISPPTQMPAFAMLLCSRSNPPCRTMARTLLQLIFQVLRTGKPYAEELRCMMPSTCGFLIQRTGRHRSQSDCC